MNEDFKEELIKLNIKMDHITKIVCELFVMSKSNERLDSKLDQCIKLLNNLNSKVDNVSNKSSIPPAPPAPPAMPSVATYSSSSTNVNYSGRNDLMEELKNKLKDRIIN